MNPSSEFDIAGILNNLFRRKGVIIATFFVVFSLAIYAAIILPNVYRSSTSIVFRGQRLPAGFVTSTVTMNPDELMKTIGQNILSRPQLERLIRELNLFSGKPTEPKLEDLIARMRRKIRIEVQKNNLLQLSFEAEDPRMAQQMAARLAALFINQNLLVREQQAIGTKSFINAEATRLRKELEEQEVVVNNYRGAHRYELPDQLDTNLRSLEQLRHELEANNVRLSALQERRGNLIKQSVESDLVKLDVKGQSVVVAGDAVTREVQVEIKKKELDSLLQRYSAKHPDVIRLSNEIVALQQAESGRPAVSKSGTPTKSSTTNPLKQVLQAQIADIEIEAQALRSQIDRGRSQIATIQTRIDNTPIRAIEGSKISRDYDITLKKYQDLLAKGLESELSENMEKNQQGEQFQISEPANFPVAPIRPNRLLIIALGLALGLGGGVGIVFLWDNFDSSFKRADEISSYVNVPLLATLPALVTRGGIVEQRRAQGILVVASFGALGVGLILVRAFGAFYF